jgi:hypothetical protein
MQQPKPGELAVFSTLPTHVISEPASDNEDVFTVPDLVLKPVLKPTMKSAISGEFLLSRESS